jgi:hypothetical protein
MIKINLISKRSHAFRGRNWTKLIALSLILVFGAYFLGVTIWVIVSLAILNNKIAKVNSESVAISNLMLANNEKLSRFVLTKLILTKIDSIDKGKFRYKDYLDQVTVLLPPGSSMTAVGFSVKGWISLAVESLDILSLNRLETVLLNKSTWNRNKYFSGAYIESVTKGKNGMYSTRLQLELKK